MKVLVTGAEGQLGADLMKSLAQRNHQAYGTGRATMDITDREQSEAVIAAVKPEAVIHCAAWTDVNGAEKNKEKAYKVNVAGTENIALLCRKYNIKLIYISTDYVFSGCGTHAWEPDNALPEPVNEYGKAKYAGERAVLRLIKKYFIVRTSWLFGSKGSNFVQTMLDKGRAHKELTVVDDQIGSPTYTVDLAELLAVMAKSDRFGIYHASNEGVCSRYELACEIFRQAAMRGYDDYAAENLYIKAVDSNAYGDFKEAAKRPLNSRMNKEKLIKSGFEKLPSWQSGVSRYLDEAGYQRK